VSSLAEEERRAKLLEQNDRLSHQVASLTAQVKLLSTSKSDSAALDAAQGETRRVRDENERLRASLDSLHARLREERRAREESHADEDLHSELDAARARESVALERVTSLEEEVAGLRAKLSDASETAATAVRAAGRRQLRESQGEVARWRDVAASLKSELALVVQRSREREAELAGVRDAIVADLKRERVRCARESEASTRERQELRESLERARASLDEQLKLAEQSERSLLARSQAGSLASAQREAVLEARVSDLTAKLEREMARRALDGPPAAVVGSDGRDDPSGSWRDEALNLQKLLADTEADAAAATDDASAARWELATVAAKTADEWEERLSRVRDEAEEAIAAAESRAEAAERREAEALSARDEADELLQTANDELTRVIRDTDARIRAAEEKASGYLRESAAAQARAAEAEKSVLSALQSADDRAKRMAVDADARVARRDREVKAMEQVLSDTRRSLQGQVLAASEELDRAREGERLARAECVTARAELAQFRERFTSVLRDAEASTARAMAAVSEAESRAEKAIADSAREADAATAAAERERRSARDALSLALERAKEATAARREVETRLERAEAELVATRASVDATVQSAVSGVSAEKRVMESKLRDTTESLRTTEALLESERRRCSDEVARSRSRADEAQTALSDAAGAWTEREAELRRTIAELRAELSESLASRKALQSQIDADTEAAASLRVNVESVAVAGDEAKSVSHRRCEAAATTAEAMVAQNAKRRSLLLGGERRVLEGDETADVEVRAIAEALSAARDAASHALKVSDSAESEATAARRVLAERFGLVPVPRDDGPSFRWVLVDEVSASSPPRATREALEVARREWPLERAMLAARDAASAECDAWSRLRVMLDEERAATNTHLREDSERSMASVDAALGRLDAAVSSIERCSDDLRDARANASKEMSARLASLEKASLQSVEASNKAKDEAAKRIAQAETAINQTIAELDRERNARIAERNAGEAEAHTLRERCRLLGEQLLEARRTGSSASQRIVAELRRRATADAEAERRLLAAIRSEREGGRIPELEERLQILKTELEAEREAIRVERANEATRRAAYEKDSGSLLAALRALRQMEMERERVARDERLATDQHFASLVEHLEAIEEAARRETDILHKELECLRRSVVSDAPHVVAASPTRRSPPPQEVVSRHAEVRHEEEEEDVTPPRGLGDAPVPASLPLDKVTALRSPTLSNVRAARKSLTEARRRSDEVRASFSASDDLQSLGQSLRGKHRAPVTTTTRPSQPKTATPSQSTAAAPPQNPAGQSLAKRAEPLPRRRATPGDHLG
jgi:hypothetical protein